MSAPTSPKPTRRRRLALPVVLAGSIASLVLALGLSPTVAAFTASIQNTVDTAGAGALTMQEADSSGNVVCNSTDGSSGISSNTATCSTINKYGGNLAMYPGQTVTTNVTIKNTGSIDAKSFTLTPGTCAQSATSTTYGSATDLCSQMTLVVKTGSTTLYSGTVAGFTAAVDILNKTSTTSVASGTTTSFSFAVTLPSTVGPTYSNLKVSQPLTWQFTS
ncbi:hypothetical protein [Microbacterium testaceum]|uniref:hypothetical protein n=1 Tax=Microbacterium testaceum TaxID=2033 RepID=UPI00124714D5|nr:hypothetical protein [Microbacterium testaceum]